MRNRTGSRPRDLRIENQSHLRFNVRSFPRYLVPSEGSEALESERYSVPVAALRFDARWPGLGLHRVLKQRG